MGRLSLLKFYHPHKAGQRYCNLSGNEWKREQTNAFFVLKERSHYKIGCYLKSAYKLFILGTAEP